MPDTFKIKVISPSGVLYEGESDFTKLPGEGGELGVLPSISPTLAKLKTGSIDVELNGVKRMFFIKSGMGRLDQESVTILTPFLDAAEDIDKSRAEQAKKRAQDRLASEDKDVDRERARQALIRAEERLRIVTR
jgi:F-type H+-transporting ATPase subunit epsilon